MVIATLASIPARERFLRKIVERLRPQVDRLGVYLNGYARVPDWLIGDGIMVARSQEHGHRGDAGKFFWCEEFPGIHLTCDDDLAYPPDYAKRMIEALDAYGRRACVSLHGSILKAPFHRYRDSRRILSFEHTITEDAPAHILGTGWLAYDTETIRIRREDFWLPNMADVWFAIAAKRQGVPLVVVKHIAKVTTRYPRQDDSSLFAKMKRNDHPHTHAVRGNLPWPLLALPARVAVSKAEPVVTAAFSEPARSPVPAPVAAPVAQKPPVPESPKVKAPPPAPRKASGRPRVLHVVPWNFVLGGSERFVHELCSRTRDVFENHVLVPLHASPFAFDGENARLHIVARALPELQRELIEHIAPGVLVHHGPYGHAKALYGAHAPAGTRVLGVIHNDILTTPGQDRAAWFNPHAIFVLFPGIRAHASWSGIRRIVMDLGVEPSMYRPREHQDRAPLRALIVSRLDKTKIPPLLLRELLAFKDDAWRIDIAGNAYYDYGRECITALKGHGLVSIIPTVAPAAMPDLYQKYDALIAPGLIEGGSYAVCEAMMAGLPVVARDTPGLRHATRGKALFTKQDRALLPLLDSLAPAVERNRIGAELRAVAEQHHDLAAQVKLFTDTVVEAMASECVA